MLDVLATLNFVWEFLKPAGADALKERLKRRESGAVARQRAIALYTSLREVRKCIDRFVGVLENYVLSSEAAEAGVFRADDAQQRLADQSCEVEHHAESIVRGLMRMTGAMGALDPQLEIYVPKLVDLLGNFGVHEAQTIEHVQREVLPEQSELAEVLRQAQHNRQMLLEAIENLRTFIAKEFAFKDAF